MLTFLFIVFVPSSISAFSYDSFSKDYLTWIHVLTVNPIEHRIAPVKASTGKTGRETVATLAQRYRARAAINGGFWKLNGQPAGALKINHHWWATPVKPRGAIGWSTSNQKVLFDRILTNYSLSALPENSQIEVIPLSHPAHTKAKEWAKVEHIVGGTPILVQNGQLMEDFSREQTFKSFIMKKHARTAVGVKENGDWVFVVVDGYFFGLLGGMTIKQLAPLMRDLGCIEALNLDGGGSSTLVIEGKVINKPCGKIKQEGKYVEAVSDAILIF